MYSAQEISTAVKSVAKGSRPTVDSISLDVSEVTDIDVLFTYSLTARSLDEASAAVERVLELDPENEVANAGFTWFLGVRDSADRLEQAAGTEPCENESEEDEPSTTAVEESSKEESFSCESFGEGPAGKAKTTGDSDKDEDASEGTSGFSSELPFAFQQVVEPLIASKEQDDDASAQAEQEEKERAEAEAAAEAK